MAYIMLSANYCCTINKAQDNQLIVGVCLLVAWSSRPGLCGKKKPSLHWVLFRKIRDGFGWIPFWMFVQITQKCMSTEMLQKVLPIDLNKEIFQESFTALPFMGAFCTERLSSPPHKKRCWFPRHTPTDWRVTRDLNQSWKKHIRLH